MITRKILNRNSTYFCKFYFRFVIESSKCIQTRHYFLPFLQPNDRCIYTATPKNPFILLKRKESTEHLLKQKTLSTIETMPSSIGYLLLEEIDGDATKPYPSITQIASLVRKMNLVQVSVDSFEEKLQSVLKLPCNHPSREYILEWRKSHEQGKTEDSRSIDAFSKVINAYVELENSRVHPDISDRLNYILVTWRLAHIIENILEDLNKHQKEISMLERLCKQIAKDSNIYTILYIYWINLLNEGSVYCVRKASRILKKYPEITIYFLDDIRKYCDEIHGGQCNFINLPKSFDIGTLILKSHKILCKDLINTGTTTSMLECNIALIFWYADMPFRSFSLLSKNYRSWASKCYDINVCSEYAYDLIFCLSLIIEDIVEEDSEIGHEYLNKLLDEVDISLPIFHYLYYAHLDNSNENKDITRKYKLLREHPDVMKLKGSCLDNLVLWGSDKKKDRIHMVSVLEEVSQLLREDSTTTVAPEVNHVDATTPEINLEFPKNKYQVESLFEELVETSDYENAINLIAEHTFSTNKTQLLIEGVQKTNNVELINQLRLLLPVQTKISDNLYVKENDLKIREINSIWNENERISALYSALLKYESVKEEEYCITPATFELALKGIRSLLRDFSQALLEDHDLEVGHISNLDLLKSFGIKFSDIYQDLSVLSIYWETLFFTHKPHYVLGAEELLVQYPFLPRNVDVDSVLHRAMKYETDEFFMKTLKFCLRFDLGDYIKSKVMGQWIIYQCEKGNSEGLRKANDLIRKARELKIPVSADALQDCLELENNLSGLSSVIARIISVILQNKMK